MKGFEIKKVCVVGGGLMGRQVALNTAIHGVEVRLHDSFPGVLEQVQTWMEDYLAGRVDKGRMTRTQAEAAKGQMTLCPGLEEAAEDADLVIEAIIEDRGAKEDLFRRLSALTRADTLLTTNSSYMPSSLFAHLVEHPDRLANLHYFNPALVMKLTEVVQGPHTSEATVQRLMDFSRATGKKPVWVRKEIDGFLANRITRAVNFEAFSLLEQGIATVEDIDTAVENGLNYPMGPFRLQDLTGIDLAYLAAQRMLEEDGFRRPGFDLIRAKVEAGELGRKTGKGWYDYTEEGK